MKVLVIVGTSLRYCPYANFYIDLLRENEIDFDVVFPDKAKLNESFSFSTIVFNWNENNNKYVELLRFRRFALKLIKSENYSCVILLTTVLSILFSSALRHKNIKYIVDIRDYTYESNSLYYSVEEKAIRGSKCCVISSPQFRVFLPRFEYTDVYNASNELTNVSSSFVKNLSSPIRISYVGTIAYPDQCERFMDLVEYDKRFIFDLYGNDLNNDRISKYIKEHNYKNSIYHGAYSPSEKKEIINKSDILFNAYGNNSPLLLYALSNKFTDAAMYSKPVINSPNTSMHIELQELSYAIDFQTTVNLDGLFDWYESLDANLVEKKSKELLEQIIQTNRNAKRNIINAIMF